MTAKDLKFYLAQIGKRPMNIRRTHKITATSRFFSMSDLFSKWYTLKSQKGVDFSLFLDYYRLSAALNTQDLSELMGGVAYMNPVVLEYVRLRCPFSLSENEFARLNKNHRGGRMISEPYNFVARLVRAPEKAEKAKSKAEWAGKSDEEKKESVRQNKDYVNSLSPEEKRRRMDQKNKLRRIKNGIKKGLLDPNNLPDIIPRIKPGPTPKKILTPEEARLAENARKREAYKNPEVKAKRFAYIRKKRAVERFTSKTSGILGNALANVEFKHSEAQAALINLLGDIYNGR